MKRRSAGPGFGLPKANEPEAIAIRQYPDGGRELMGDWPELTELSLELLADDSGLLDFDGERLLVTVNSQQQQAYRFLSRSTQAALFLREDIWLAQPAPA